MRHHNTIRKFGRPARQRSALLRSLARSLILKERITTTEAKAKELRPFLEKLVSKARRGSLSDRRLAVQRLGDEKAGKKLLSDIAPKYALRTGGYLRIVKIPPRPSDSARRAIIEFV